MRRIRENSRLDPNEWRRSVVFQAVIIREFETKVGDRKVAVFVDASNFNLEPAYADAYGKAAKEIVGRFASSLFRYGDPGGITKVVARCQAVIHRYPANFYADRDAALAALERLRADPTQ